MLDTLEPPLGVPPFAGVEVGLGRSNGGGGFFLASLVSLTGAEEGDVLTNDTVVMGSTLFC